MPSVPMIVVNDEAQAEQFPHVVFSSPAAAPNETERLSAIRFSISGEQTQSLAPSSTAMPANPMDVAATAVGHEKAPAVSFAPPQIEKQPRYSLREWERETLAACLVLEAASQGEYGMRAVMAVIRNRAGGHPRYFASTVMRPKQFSALNKVTSGQETLSAAVRRAKRDHVWNTAIAIVDDALDDTWQDPTGGATHYTRAAEHTHWTRRLAKTTTIGAHSFYR